MLDDDNNNNYYKTNVFLRFLRFLNLLEPDRNILSISKIYMWVMLGVLIFVFIVVPSNLDIVISASAALVGTMLNYSYRRWTQTNNIKYDRNEDSSNGGGYGNYGGYGDSYNNGFGNNNYSTHQQIDIPEEDRDNR